MNTRQGKTAAVDAEYAALFDTHRRELIAHCYRMTGSFTDAEESRAGNIPARGGAPEHDSKDAPADAPGSTASRPTPASTS